MKQILKYIDEHLKENISLKQISDIAGYSEFHFSRMFKKSTGSTLQAYIIKRRLIKSSEDIVNGKRIIDVALEYGWESHSGFTKSFKKEFGFSPSLLKALIIEIDGLGGNSMGHVFLESAEIGIGKEKLFDILCELLEKNNIVYNKDELELAYQEACAAYVGVTRYSGEEYVTHTLNVAIILAQLEADINSIIAGMFCDVYRKGVISLDGLNDGLNSSVMRLITDLQTQDVENASDEILLIKLAERLHNMRTIKYMDEDKKKEKIKQTIDIYMPIARKLGNEKLINELNDLTLE